MKRLLPLLFLLVLTATAFARLSIQEWTVTYFKSECDAPCLRWMGDADSAKVHYTAVERDGSLISLTADTTLFR